MEWYNHMANEQQARSYGGKLFGLWKMFHSGVLSCNVPNTYVVEHDADLTDPNVTAHINGYLKMNSHPDTKYAVRSSGTGEDGEAQSYAGQHLTVLDVPLDGIINAIRACRESGQWSEEYASATTGERQEMPINVLIQKMIPAHKAGVMFTGDPDSGVRDRIIIEYVEGLGDKLVGGEVSPDGLGVREPDGEIRMSPTVDDATTMRMIFNLFEVATDVEGVFGQPMDVEWASNAYGDITLLQARPLTGVEWGVNRYGRGITSGVAEGIVQRMPSDLEFGRGRVLATKMTDPRMVKAMIKSCAIVTEIGGRTCHAAIVARELKKPCIVGCSAVRGLRDGMQVKVDATNGRLDVKA